MTVRFVLAALSIGGGLFVEVALAQSIGLGNGNAGLRLGFSQGSQRSISSTSASLTTMNGVPGSLQVGVIRPFVTGVTPIVAAYPRLVDPSQVSARLGARRYAALRQSQATRHSKKLAQYLRRAALAESEGNVRMARANYRQAIRIAPPPLRARLQWRLGQLTSK